MYVNGVYIYIYVLTNGRYILNVYYMHLAVIQTPPKNNSKMQREKRDNKCFNCCDCAQQNRIEFPLHLYFWWLHKADSAQKIVYFGILRSEHSTGAPKYFNLRFLLDIVYSITSKYHPSVQYIITLWYHRSYKNGTHQIVRIEKWSQTKVKCFEWFLPSIYVFMNQK